MSTDLVLISDDGSATTTSLIVAEGTENQHKNVLDLIRHNLADFEEFGVLAFETRKSDAGPGRPEVFAVLNEEHATLLLTYMRNSTVVKDFKKRLVHAFYALRRRLAELEGPQLMARAVIEAQAMLAKKDERIAALDAKVAEDAPKVNYVELYVADTDLLKLRVVAANNNVGEEWLRDLLVAKGWVYVETESRFSERKGCKEIRRRYSAYAHKRSYFRPVEVHEAPRFRGEVMHTLKVTPVGAEAISRLIVKEVAA